MHLHSLIHDDGNEMPDALWARRPLARDINFAASRLQLNGKDRAFRRQDGAIRIQLRFSSNVIVANRRSPSHIN